MKISDEFSKYTIRDVDTFINNLKYDWENSGTLNQILGKSEELMEDANDVFFNHGFKQDPSVTGLIYNRNDKFTLYQVDLFIHNLFNSPSLNASDNTRNNIDMYLNDQSSSKQSAFVEHYSSSKYTSNYYQKLNGIIRNYIKSHKTTKLKLQCLNLYKYACDRCGIGYKRLTKNKTKYICKGK